MQTKIGIAEDSLVTLVDGSMKPIKDIWPGTKVLDWQGTPQLVKANMSCAYTGTLLDFKTLSPHDNLITSLRQEFLTFPTLFCGDEFVRYHTKWQPAGLLAPHGHLLVPWASANKTNYYQNMPIGNLDNPVSVAEIAYSWIGGVIVPLIEIDPLERVGFTLHTLQLKAGGGFIANGVAVASYKPR